ncbi:MAG TPA: PEP-CTERM sorting domain-containing protein [Bryobacteraceae bacterium]|nr:PEP-CTERM sorting domain-containing protein [Bryobacteraceae bacterium]
MSAGSLLVFGLASTAMADISPVDPHALFASGGDATPLGSGQPITLSSPAGPDDQGGGIFVFNNDTGMALSAVKVSITMPESFFNGFSFTGTLFTPGPSASSISEVLFSGKCKTGADTADFFCVQLTFAENPGPIVPIGGNFVIDFDKPASQGPPPVYGGVDQLVATGLYTGDTDTSDSRVGEWANGANGFVDPVFATPEPRQYAGILGGIFALAIFLKRKRSVATA